MTRLQAPKGTRDLLPADWSKFKRIEESFLRVGRAYGFHPLELPLFESTQVFTRAVGEQTDIVSKEMYTFNDRNGDSFTLRPEGTASLVRAFVENSLQQKLPQKLIYSGPMFRYERPQKGRYRQFYQIGAELLGLDSPVADLEGLSYAFDALKDCHLTEKVQLEINTIGNKESRETYLKKFLDYLTPFEKELSEESQIRLQKNPLRILDSKQSQDQKFLADAPTLEQNLDEVSRKHFDFVLNGLARLGISYSINARLVRGLDYYNHTVFEFTTSHLGSQNAVLSGGRYDGLVKDFGGPQVPAFGWGAGLDRLVLLDARPSQFERPVVVMGFEESDELVAFDLVRQLRQKGIYSEIVLGRQVGKKLKKAQERFDAWAVVICGGDEGQRGEVVLKWMDKGEQITPRIEEASTHIGHEWKTLETKFHKEN